MKYRKLGKSDLLISEVSFGCMSLKPGHYENQALINKAIDKGISYFDTADLYDFGENEKMLGKALKNQRKNVFIGTKVGHEWSSNKTSWKWNPTKKGILRAIDDSLLRLQTDYIDLYQLHGGTIEDPIDDLIEAMERLIESGKIRYYGISSIRPNVIREYVSKSNICSVMMQYSLLDRRPEETCLDLLEKNGIGMLARGVLAKGLLINKSPKPYLDHSKKDVKEITQFILNASEPDSAITNPISFVLHNKVVTSAVIGFSSIEKLRQLINDRICFDLNSKMQEGMQNIAKPYTYLEHR